MSALTSLMASTPARLCAFQPRTLSWSQSILTVWKARTSLTSSTRYLTGITMSMQRCWRHVRRPRHLSLAMRTLLVLRLIYLVRRNILLRNTLRYIESKSRRFATTDLFSLSLGLSIVCTRHFVPKFRLPLVVNFIRNRYPCASQGKIFARAEGFTARSALQNRGDHV
jgi:hypothetical protein